MTTSIRILPVDYKSPEDREADINSLILRLERQGKVRSIQPMKMLQARTLYCKKLLPKRRVARKVGITISDLDRWILLDDWDKLRHETEFRYYQKVTGIRRRSIPDIDAKHDQMFHNLESLVEDTVHRVRQKNIELEPKELVSLANAAKICMESRRTIHKKEGPTQRHIFELDDPSLFNEVAGMIVDMAKSKNSPVELSQIEKEEIKQIPYTIEDEHLEQEKDLT